ncbi:MAG: helix-turn-helix transcriptional regulator [Chloroflexi bacterium]|nr:MAG: helix-turn-helix transcriptional regulator [Chloroflexota bacterium]TMB94567.1 MAG: helix-turn-helix transcriptional regulator [Chloroflexota bacterium]TMC28582.1 MAG: helix-turn-helix transcriptional regulator [Chloroflexota bacterium]TMC34671.1 MAG: helix-turn-helix transcriptional regulator [Chloroflexota bacterium]TMC55890.1 MAG: helix-turn-helix transcriptional regulator [Chloroflexota bacterium]
MPRPVASSPSGAPPTSRSARAAVVSSSSSASITRWSEAAIAARSVARAKPIQQREGDGRDASPGRFVCVVRGTGLAWLVVGGACGYAWARQVIASRDLPSGLTARQTEILTLVARGMSSKQIALHEGISRNSVDTHIRRARRALGVNSRAAAAAAVSGRDHTATPARPRPSATRSSAATTSVTRSSNGT